MSESRRLSDGRLSVQTDTVSLVEDEPLIQKKRRREKDPKEILSIWIKLLYGLPNLPFSLAVNFYGTYIYYYYTDTVGVPLELLNAAYIYLLFFMVWVFPVMGWVFDNTNSRMGRRRPWIVFATPALYICCFFMWCTPYSFPEFLTQIFSREMLYCLWYSLFYALGVVLTYVVQTPYIAWGVELTLDFDERSSLFGYSQAFYIVGMIIATGMPEVLLKWYPDTRDVFLMIAVVSGVIGTILFEIMAFTLKERPDFVHPKSTPLIPGLRAAFLENKPFMILLLVITFSNSAPYTLSLLPYWVQYTLELDAFSGAIIMTVFITSGIVTIPFWNWLSRVWGKRKSYAASLVFAFVGYSLMAFPSAGQFWLALIFSAISGSSGGYLTNSNFLYQSLQGDVMDYDEFRTGMRREALYNNIMQFFNWYMSAFSTSAPFILLARLGFQADKPQTETVKFGLALIVGAFGVFELASAIVLMAFYPITKQQHYRIMEGVRDHKLGLDVPDMFSNDVVPSLAIKTDEELDKFWLMYTFSHFELRRAVVKGTNVLKRYMCYYILAWTVAMGLGILVTYYNQHLYYIYAYLVLFAFCMILYHALRLKASFELEKKISTGDIEEYLLFKQYSSKLQTVF